MKQKRMNIPYKIYRAYYNQEKKAASRGIKMLFSLEEWIAWWEANLGPRWFELRGCKRAQYVMARYNDMGNYEPENVKCILAGSNVSEAGIKRIGARAGNVKLTKTDVVRIRKIKDKFDWEIAAEYGVSRTHISAIRLKRKWKHI